MTHFRTLKKRYLCFFPQPFWRMTMTVYYGNYEPKSSLVDAEWERWKAEERKQDVRDNAFNNYFLFWRKFAYLDRNQKRGEQEIAEIMAAVMADLHGQQSASKFGIALFRWYCVPDSEEAKAMVYAFLEEGIKKEIRKQWEQEHA
jgi:hypothetical protein